MTGISVVVITKNEEANIEECLRSCFFSDDIIVVDAESSDATVTIAQRFTEKVFVRPWEGFSAAKQFGVDRTKNDWVLWLDADERVLPELAAEIRETVERQPSAGAFTVARRAYFLGRWIRHSGWYPGRVTRLFHKGRARFNDNAVHEGLIVEGETGTLTHDLLHWTDPTIGHYFSKFNRYTTLAAEERVSRGKKFSSADLFIRPLWQFLKMYVFRRGFLDGKEGLLLALFSSAYVLTKYAKVWERQTSPVLVHKRSQ